MDSVDRCTEYVVPSEFLLKSTGLEVVELANFHDFFESYRGRFAYLLDRMKVQRLTDDEWDAAGLYRVVVLRRAAVVDD